MPADIMEKASSSPVAATPASLNATPDKPKTASENRKSSKPIMEKRRRARINESLSQLKTLILDALKKDSSRHSKLEKADILEMTVKHLRNLQRVQMTAALSTDPTVLGKYRAGFSECMNEVTRFLSTCEGVNTEVRTRLLSHLANCMSQINAMNYSQAAPSPAVSGSSHAAFGQPLHVQLPGSGGSGMPLNGVNMPCKLAAAEAMPAAAKVYGGFQLVPASDGQFAFLIPNTAFGPNGQLTAGPVIPLYANANVSALPSALSPASRSPVQQPAITPVAGFPLPLSAATTAVSPVSVNGPTDSSDSVWRPW
ncbi:transcription factor HES-1-B-like [Chiloscyllium punctatum]|nr:hairy-related 6 [Chiloscyllium plagiosum]